MPLLKKSPVHLATWNIKQGPEADLEMSLVLGPPAVRGSAHHQSDHNGKPIGDLIGRFNQDDSETDRHPHNPTQESRRTNQGKGPRIDVAQSNVAGEEKNNKA